jgi:hypothetical protein
MGSSANDIKNALNDLPTLAPNLVYNVTVTSQSGNDLIYLVTFSSDLGNVNVCVKVALRHECSCIPSSNKICWKYFLWVKRVSKFFIKFFIKHWPYRSVFSDKRIPKNSCIMVLKSWGNKEKN